MFAAKGFFENRLAQTVGAGEVGFDGCFEFFDDGQAALDFGDDLFLFVMGRKGHIDCLDNRGIQIRLGGTLINSPKSSCLGVQEIQQIQL